MMFRNGEVQRTIGTGLASSPWATAPPLCLSIYTPFCCSHVSALFLDDLIQSKICFKFSINLRELVDQGYTSYIEAKLCICELLGLS